MITKEQVDMLNQHQNSGKYHPYTCCSYNGCERDKQPNWGQLIATEECWVCPCGDYKQEYRGEVESITRLNNIKDVKD
jgi:hypothetical protein